MPANPHYTYANPNVMPRALFIGLLLSIVQTAQNHLSDEEEAQGDDLPPEYTDGVNHGAIALVRALVAHRYDLPGQLKLAYVQDALKVGTFLYDDGRCPLVERFLLEFEQPLDVLDAQLQALRDTIKGMHDGLDAREIAPTGDTYNALHDAVDRHVRYMLTVVDELKQRGN